MKYTHLRWPDSIQAIQTSAQTVTDKVGAAMSSAVGRVTVLESDASYGRHALSQEAATLLGLRQELEGLSVRGQVITTTPYQFQVGSRLTSGSYLTPNVAMNVLSNKLRDHADQYRPTHSINCVAILLTSEHLKGFTQKLGELVNVFPLSEWCQAYRQASSMLTNETDKFYQSSPIVQPRFKPVATLNCDPVRRAELLHCSHVATLESLADDQKNVIAKLKALATKRDAQLSETRNSIEALKMLQGGVWGMKLSGTPGSIATALSQTAVPNNDQYTIASLILSTSPLTFWEELLCSA